MENIPFEVNTYIGLTLLRHQEKRFTRLKSRDKEVESQEIWAGFNRALGVMYVVHVLLLEKQQRSGIRSDEVLCIEVIQMIRKLGIEVM